MRRTCAAGALAATVIGSALPAMAAQIDLVLGFSPAAQDKLDSLGERVVVSVMYYGEAAAGHEDLMAEDGTVPLGNETYDIFALPQIVTIGGSAAGIPDGLVVALNVNVNIFTARLKDDNNLLHCGIVDDALDRLDGTTQEIACSLIGE